jgi:hypothetical protein
MDLDHPGRGEFRHAPAANPTRDLDSRFRQLQIDRVKADGAAASVELDLERDLATKRTASLRVDFDVDVYALRPDTRIESVARCAGGHGGFRFELRLRSRGVRWLRS